MVPAAFVFLDEMPLTPSGKADRKALPAPDWTDQASGAYEAPQTQLEEIVAGIWSDVLDLPEIGVQQDFFELGGHSLLATQVVSRIRKAFEVELPLRVLFENSTIAGLAIRIASSLKQAPGAIAPALKPSLRDQPLPLSFAQQRLWFLDQLDPNATTYNIPWTMRMKGRLNVAALEHALQQIMQRHEALRTT